MSRFRLLLCVCLLFGGLSLAGCMKGEQTIEDTDAPDNHSADETEAENKEDDVNEQNDEVTETEETVSRELYLIDENGLVVPETFDLPKSKSAAMQVMEYLVKDGPITELLPSGFEAVLPAGTEILGVNLDDDGTLIVDVSEDFSNYDPDHELQIIQAMTHTLTQFESVEAIKLWINGQNQTEMPVNHTPLSKGFSRADGINLDMTEQPNLQHNETVTMFYPKQYDKSLKYVPVTKYINTAENKNRYSSIVEMLLNGPSYDIMVKNVFNDHTQIVNDPTVKDGVLDLEFSEAILQEEGKPVIADDVMETLVRTLTGQAEVDAIHVSVENHDAVSNENGEEYSHPVTMEDFEIKEKM